jgi:hypothetical protein
VFGDLRVFLIVVAVSNFDRFFCLAEATHIHVTVGETARRMLRRQGGEGMGKCLSDPGRWFVFGRWEGWVILLLWQVWGFVNGVN